MFTSKPEYDRGVNTFSPEGRLFQVEYAMEAIKFGSTAIAILCNDGVIISTEKRLTSPLIEPSSVEKIVEIDEHCACAVSGLIADGKTLVDRARVEAQSYWYTFNEKMSIESITSAVANLSLAFSEQRGRNKSGGISMSRPFGVAMLFAGIDETGPHLFQLDPSGTYIEYNAKAIGSGFEGADQSLEEIYDKSMSIDEAIVHSLSILKQVMEESMKENNVEVAVITKADGKQFRLLSSDEIQQYVNKLDK